jgi:hypothetical protein
MKEISKRIMDFISGFGGTPDIQVNVCLFNKALGLIQVYKKMTSLLFSKLSRLSISLSISIWFTPPVCNYFF